MTLRLIRDENIVSDRKIYLLTEFPYDDIDSINLREKLIKAIKDVMEGMYLSYSHDLQKLEHTSTGISSILVYKKEGLRNEPA